MRATAIAALQAGLARPAPAAQPVLQRKCACGAETHGGGACDACRRKREGTLQRSAIDGGGALTIPPIVHDVLREPGQPLDRESRTPMERQFGHDFSGVRVHTGPLAAASADAVSARAYTVGRDVVMNAGEYRPASADGGRLLAHELTHVVQQAGGGGVPGAAHEREADAAARAVGRGEPFRVAGGSAVGVARAPGSPTAPAAPAVTPEIQQHLTEELRRVRLETPFERTDAEGQTHVTPALSGTIGQHKNRTVAVAAIIKADGAVTYQSAHFDEGMAEHAEPQLLRRIAAQVQQGDTVAIAIDQVPCPPGRANCQGTLKEFREDPQHGSLRVYTVRAFRRDAPPTATPAAADPSQLVSPKTAVTRAEDERFLFEEKEFRRVRLPIYAEPPATSGAPRTPTSPAAPAPAAAPKAPAAPRPPAAPAAPAAEELEAAARATRVRAAVGEIGFNILLMILAAYIQGKVDEMRMEQMWEKRKPELGERMKALWPTVLALRAEHPNAPLYANLTVENQYSRSGKQSPTMFLDFGAVQLDVGTTRDDRETEIGKTDYLPGVTIERMIAHVAVQLDVPTEEDRRRAARAAEQLEITERLRRVAAAAPAKAAAGQPAPAAPAAPAALPLPTRDASASFVPASASAVGFLPGASGEGPVEQAARFVRGAEAFGQKLVAEGAALAGRIGTNAAPTSAERAAFARSEEQWRLTMRYFVNWFRDRARDEAVQAIMALLEAPTGPGPKLAELRSRLGDG